MLQALKQPHLPDVQSSSLTTYLLLESEVLEEWLMQQPDAPEQPSIADFVRTVDYATSRHWVWSETEYDQYRSDGPLLVQYHPGSDLPALFLDQWAAIGGAVFMASARPIDDVLAQLREVLFVLMPNGNKARWRLQETAALASILGTLEPHRAAALLGPVQELIWRENFGPVHQWWRYQHAHGPLPVQGGFQFSHGEMTAIDTGLGEHHLRKNIALTQQAPHSFYDSARRQTLIWLDQLKRWGFEEIQHLDSALEAFRHPAYSKRADVVITLLQDPSLTPGARATQALNHLMTEGH